MLRFGIVFLSLLVLGLCQTDTIGRTPWVYIRGPSTFTLNPYTGDSQHGDPAEFSAAVIPDENANWLPCDDSFCTSGDDIGVETSSRLSGCWTWLDFSYFQSYVTIPVDVVVTTFTIDFTIMDDGAEIYVFNTDYPDGVLVPGSLVELGGSLNFNFEDTSYIIAGSNRLVIVQVDDCAVLNNIVAQPTINGNQIPVATNPDGTPCDDGDACTHDDSWLSNVCTGTPNVCTAEDQCHFAGVCDSSTGICSNPARSDGSSCEDGNACTSPDTCKAGVCTSGSYICCHSNKGCGLCVPSDCGTETATVLKFFDLTSGLVCPGAPTGHPCPNKGICCSPQYQTTSFYASATNVCSVAA